MTICCSCGNLTSKSRKVTLHILRKHTLPDTETDLQRHPCHLQCPEVQANLCLPSLQAHQEAQSDQLDLDDPGAGREGNKKLKVRQKH